VAAQQTKNQKNQTKNLKNSILKASACQLHAHTTTPRNRIGSMCQMRECRSIRAKITVTLLLCTTRTRSQLLGRVIGVAVLLVTNKQTNKAVWRPGYNKPKPKRPDGLGNKGGPLFGGPPLNNPNGAAAGCSRRWHLPIWRWHR